MARILAIDYGGKRTGLATTDPEQIIASPLGFQATDQLIEFLQEYFSQEAVELVVLGYPTRDDGSDTDATHLVRRFKDVFTKEFPGKKIILQDESNTSRMAVEAMVTGGMKKKKRQEKGNVDSIAATLILQAYLDSR